MEIANKTGEQKVDLLRKFVSPKLDALVVTLAHEIADNDYTAWNAQMNTFAKGLMNHDHRLNLDKKKVSQNTGFYTPTTPTTPATAIPVGEPMDLDRISDNERKRRVDNRLCLACGQPGHWKEAHDPAKTANPIPMPSRQATPHLNRGNPRGRGIHYGQGGRSSPNPTGTPAQVTSYMGAYPFNKPPAVVADAFC